MKTKTYFFIFLTLMFIQLNFAQNNTGGIKVYVANKKKPKEIISFVDITIYTDSTEVHGTTNTDGNYRNTQLIPGKYNVIAAHKGYQTKIVKNLFVLPDKMCYINVYLNIDSTNEKKADTTEYKDPVIDPSTAGILPVKSPFLPKLFFKFSSLNFDTLSNNYYENDLHIIDTIKAIDYIVKYIIEHPNEHFMITGYFDANEQEPDELSDLRAEKVANLLVRYGIPKEKTPRILPYKSRINSDKIIRHASTKNEKEQLHKLNRCVMLTTSTGPNTSALPPKKYTPFFPRLFFKLNSTNFDTLSNYYGNDLHINDTNKVIDYMVKYILDNFDERIVITAHFDTNEQNQEELVKQRAEKVVNLLIRHGLPKEKVPEIFPYRGIIKSDKIIQNASTEKEKEELHKTNRCVMFRPIKG